MTEPTTAKKAFSYLRMSTPEQLRGDSLRRQLLQARDYCQANGLELVEDMRDIGISAYTGANAAEGAALAQFLNAIRNKKVERGSTLCIESLDRLSRQAVFKAFGLFSEIVNAGVKIVTLADGKVYDSELNLGDMITSIVTMARAHDESKMKSLRIQAVWNKKRDDARRGKKMTRTCPAWLRPKENMNGFDVDKARAKVVKQIFEDTVERDLGLDVIMKLLNKAKVPTFGNSRGWGKSSVYRILQNRAVIGEHRPTVNSKPGGDDEIISDYFPPIISESLFYRAQERLDKRRQKGGRKGEQFNNIFAGIIRCGACGDKMRQRSFGRARGRILACENVQRGMGCTATASWKYSDLETSFLRFVSEVDLATVMGQADESGERRRVEEEIHAVEGKLVEARKKRERTYELLTGDEATAFLRTQFDELDKTVANLEKMLDELRTKLRAFMTRSDAALQSRREIVSLIQQLGVMKGDKAFRVRAALAARVREIIKVVRVYPGERKIGDSTVPPNRYFACYFRDGTARAVAPAAEDPTKFIIIGHTTDGIVTDGAVRFLLARYGFTDPNPEQFEEMASDLAMAGRFRWALGMVERLSATGDEALLPLDDKWEPRRAGPDQSAAVLAELKARRDPGR